MQTSPRSGSQTPEQIRGRILNLLADFQTLTPQDLAAGLDLDVDVVTSHLQVLMNWDWIVSVPGYRLTTSGRAAVVPIPSVVKGG